MPVEVSFRLKDFKNALKHLFVLKPTRGQGNGLALYRAVRRPNAIPPPPAQTSRDVSILLSPLPPCPDPARRAVLLTPATALFPTTGFNYRQSMPESSIKPIQLSLIPLLSAMIVSACRKRRSTGRRSLDILSIGVTALTIPPILLSPL